MLCFLKTFAKMYLGEFEAGFVVAQREKLPNIEEFRQTLFRTFNKIFCFLINT